MADKQLLKQMLEHLVNDDQAKAEELFHEYVVQQSREIYESLIDSEIAEEKDEDDEDEDDAAEDEKVDEEFEDIAIEADDEDPDMMGGDPTDDLEGDLEMGDDDMEEKSEEELFQDLDSIVDELQAKFDELKGGDDMGDMGDDDMGDMGGDEMKDDFELETVREYVDKVAPAKMGDNGVNNKSIVAGKNDMGGTTANILSGKNGAPGSETGELKGSGLLKGKPTEDNAGNINVPGGKAGSAFSKKEPGHGAEKAGSKESADNKQSLFRGRR
jgi:hypothetical protein